MSSDTIDLLSQIATWVTVVLVFFTLQEMVRQRRSSYRPDLVVLGSGFHAYISESHVANAWFPEPLEPDDEDWKHSRRWRLPLHMHNLGLGACKDITIAWDFEFADAVRQAKGSDWLEAQGIAIELNEKDHYIKLKYPGPSTSFISLSDLNRSVEFVLPSSVEQSGTATTLPGSIMELISLLIVTNIQDARNMEPEAFNLPDFPQFSLELRYKDIGGKRYSKRYIASIATKYFLAGELMPGDYVFSGFLNLEVA